MPERRWSLTKIEPGDYLLPSNHDQGDPALTIYRIAKYDESTGRVAWGAWAWSGDLAEYVDTGSWDRWRMVAGPLDTRQAAIDAALSIGEGPECRNCQRPGPAGSAYCCPTCAFTQGEHHSAVCPST